MKKKKDIGKRAMCKLLAVTIICFIFMTAEVIGGLISGSLAIMTDAAHMLSDVAAFLISYTAIFLSHKPATFRLTYGYHRAEVLGALASIVLIWGLLIWLIVEAIDRIVSDAKVDGEVMLITACFGLGCNIVNIFTLHSFGNKKKEEEEEEELTEQEI